jgi:hypothetical protein
LIAAKDAIAIVIGSMVLLPYIISHLVCICNGYVTCVYLFQL